MNYLMFSPAPVQVFNTIGCKIECFSPVFSSVYLGNRCIDVAGGVKSAGLVFVLSLISAVCVKSNAYYLVE